MYDDLVAQFHEDVVAGYRDFRGRQEEAKAGASRDLKAAVQAASSLYHFREHLPSALALSKNRTVALCPEYELIGDIANASKHRVLTRGMPIIASATSLKELVYTVQFEDADGQYTHVMKRVKARAESGAEIDVLELATKVVNFWGSYLEKHGILESFNPFLPLPGPDEVFISRSEAKGLDLEMNHGVRFKILGQLLKYDPALKRSKPVNLTGSKGCLRIYKQDNPILDITLTHHETDEKFKGSYRLTSKEETEFNSLLSDDTRKAFLQRIMRSRKPMGDQSDGGS